MHALLLSKTCCKHQPVRQEAGDGSSAYLVAGGVLSPDQKEVPLLPARRSTRP